MESLSDLRPLGRLHKRLFQREFRARWSQSLHSWDSPILLGQWFFSSTRQWNDLHWLSKGVPIAPTPHKLELYTDASMFGWGGHINTLNALGKWTVTQSNWHINRLELEAMALSFREFLRGKAVRLFTDNTTVAFYMNKQGGGQDGYLSQSE